MAQLIKIEGSAVDTISETTLVLDLEFGSAEGKLQLNVDESTLNIGKLDIKLDGGAGGFYQVRGPTIMPLFFFFLRISINKWRATLPQLSSLLQDIVNLIEGPLKSVLGKIFGETVSKVLNEIAAAVRACILLTMSLLHWQPRARENRWPDPLACPSVFPAQVLPKVPVTLPLGDNLEVDYALVNTSNLQGLSGTHYHDNDFGGDKYAIVCTGGSSLPRCRCYSAGQISIMLAYCDPARHLLPIHFLGNHLQPHVSFIRF